MKRTWIGLTAAVFVACASDPETALDASALDTAAADAAPALDAGVRDAEPDAGVAPDAGGPDAGSDAGLLRDGGCATVVRVVGGGSYCTIAEGILLTRRRVPSWEVPAGTFTGGRPTRSRRG